MPDEGYVDGADFGDTVFLPSGGKSEDTGGQKADMRHDTDAHSNPRVSRSVSLVSVSGSTNHLDGSSDTGFSSYIDGTAVGSASDREESVSRPASHKEGSISGSSSDDESSHKRKFARVLLSGDEADVESGWDDNGASSASSTSSW